jgi:hypothetical protein
MTTAPASRRTGALATVDCTETNVPTGPKVARYSLFADQVTLDQHFKDAIAENSELVRCPGSDTDSPTAWHYNANPDEVAGQVACGTYDGNPDVTWTKTPTFCSPTRRGQTSKSCTNGGMTSAESPLINLWPTAPRILQESFKCSIGR